MTLNASNLEAVFGNQPIFQALKTMTPDERIQLVEEMDAEVEAQTDPATKRAIEMEHQVFRMMLRAFV